MNWKPGTILKRPIGGFFGILFSHTGVYIGNGVVIHFNGEKKEKRRRGATERYCA